MFVIVKDLRIVMILIRIEGKKELNFVMNVILYEESLIRLLFEIMFIGNLQIHIIVIIAFFPIIYLAVYDSKISTASSINNIQKRNMKL